MVKRGKNATISHRNFFRRGKFIKNNNKRKKYN